jgi:hypothetical protein
MKIPRRETETLPTIDRRDLGAVTGGQQGGLGLAECVPHTTFGNVKSTR